MDTNSFYLVECELLLDDRLVHFPDRSQVFCAVAGDCVYKTLLDLFKFVKKFQKYKKIKNSKILLMIVEFDLWKFWLMISLGI